MENLSIPCREHSPAAAQGSIIIGLDVGSTTVKATVVDPDSRKILWSDYQRHHTRQAETVLDFLVRIGNAYSDVGKENIRIFITGSGAAPLKAPLGAHFVQEVNAVTMAVEALHPDVRSVVELGGQDAKIILFKHNEATGERRVQTSMNDKCASGTGATIDKCMIKVGVAPEYLREIIFNPDKLHHVAAKCGVFAETDIVNLVKTGIPADEILCSLADAIVMQNLSVLARGSTLKDKVLLLGGPNCYLPFLQECWRKRIPETWRERAHTPADHSIEDLIVVPEAGLYYAAYGAVLFGIHEPAGSGRFKGIDSLREFVEHGRKARLGDNAGPPLADNETALKDFMARFEIPPFKPAVFVGGERVRGTIGLDGGSTSSKAVLIGDDGEVLLKEYQLSKGNPIQDAKELLGKLDAAVRDQGAVLDVLGFGVTGYAAPVLEKSLRADVNIVETVAHMTSALRYHEDADVICDIGGQDIKVLLLEAGTVRDFRLSNQCSAGNGMLLQAMADQFGIPVTEYAGTAFEAALSPKFTYGCAVFLDADRVNFQKEGFNKEELLAGLALVLPKNVWQYVVQIPRMAELGRCFVLQGGTQYNLAALKAQVDYIEARVHGADVRVHPHPGEAGALGAAFETQRIVRRRGHSTFVGLRAAIDIEYGIRNDETTRCTFCANNCSRSFIDTATPDGTTARYIAGFSCDKGTVEDNAALKRMVAERTQTAKAFPNLVAYEAERCFKHGYDASPLPEAGLMINDVRIRRSLLGKKKRQLFRRAFERSGESARARRKSLRIAMPKVLNMWSTGPFWRTYFETLGIDRSGVVFSEDSSEELWQEGGKYGSVDACYPSKVAQAHIHNLLFHRHSQKKPLDYIYFPCITHIPSRVENIMDTAACPIVAGTPKVIRAAFTKEVDFFAQRDIDYVDHAVTLSEPRLLKRQMFEAWSERLEITSDESDYAVDEAFRALRAFDADLQEKGKALLETVEAENRVAILMIGRPYHNDPGLNHGILEEFQALGYPILSMRSIPDDKAWLQRYFQHDLDTGRVKSPLEITDVWPENYSTNSAQKVWAAKFAARHPNIAVLDLSSFKCGHDAPTYGLIDRVMAASPTPHSALHDIDANKPSGSIQIRVKTYAHTLKLREERLSNLACRGPLALSTAGDERCCTQESIPATADRARENVRALVTTGFPSARARLDETVVPPKHPHETATGCANCTTSACGSHPSARRDAVATIQ